MEKLDKVIAGLECCSSENVRCDGCPYDGGGGKVCMRALMTDALDLVEDLKIAVIAAGVLERYRAAFEKLAEGKE